MEPVDTNSDMTVERVSAIVFPDETAQMEVLTNSEMPANISDYQPLIAFFGIQSVDQKTQEQLKNVWEYFSQDAKNPGTVLKRIKMQQYNLAQPALGDTRLNQLNNYVRILGQLRDVKDLKEAYEQ